MSRSHQIYKGRIVDLRIEDVTLPNQTTISLELVRHPGAAAVVPVHDDGSVTLVHQFRHAAGGFIWEIPAGKLDAGEGPARCAARELAEETGLAAQEWVGLGAVLTAPGFCDERIHLFLARRLTVTRQRLEYDEVLSVERLPLAQALEMVRSNEIEDAKTIAGLYRAAEFLKREGSTYCAKHNP